MAIAIADSSCSPTRSLGLLLDPEKVDLPRPKQSMWHRLGFRRWLGRDDRDFSSRSPPAGSDSPPTAAKSRSKRNTNTSTTNKNDPKPNNDSNPPAESHSKLHDNLTRRLSRKVGVGIPRATTFRRQHSEHRDRLSPIDPEPRRAVSADRRTLSAQRTRSPQPVVDPRLSAPEVPWREVPDETTVDEPPETNEDSEDRSEWNQFPDVADAPEEPPDDIIDMELQKRWILNLSMHFRDRSEREKFFVTYAEAPNRWRRVTISCDYRDAPPDSLEQDLRELRYQRDKCARIYESIRESLPEIQFYDTVTNLKLETRDGRLHVHVTEDVNETIPYPPVSCIGHLSDARLIPERRLHFEAHLSGFVYNVKLDGKTFIKKEIPGPDTVDEFLYEINALHALQGLPSVVQVEGIVVDDHQEVVKGLLISFAEKGALVDILYESQRSIPWERRERWARQIVQGLCEIHEAGYVQGDFTLSNIVVDANDNAKIIDINRRGCPVGWEPPEIAAKIESNQRISMYIGVKTDLFQLGMTLWALAMEEDEPERQPRPFKLAEDLPIPDYYRRLVSTCLSKEPRQRLSAKELLQFFPRLADPIEQHRPWMHPGVGLHNSALPLYDSRAAFPYPYPRGRPVTGIAHNHIAIAQDVPQRDTSSESDPPFPGADRTSAIGNGEEVKEPHTRIEELTHDQPNGVLSGPFVNPETPLSRHNHTSVPPSPDTQPTTNGGEGRKTLEQQTLPEYDDNDIDLDATVDPCYRISPTDSDTDFLPFDTQLLPGELVGVGGHPACSLQPPLGRNLGSSFLGYQESPVSSAATRSTPDPYPIVDLGHAMIQDDDWSSQDASRSVSSLFHSILPINPAAEISDRKTIDTTVPNIPPLRIRPTLGFTRHRFQESTPYLSDSHLPINPAFSDNVWTSSP